EWVGQRSNGPETLISQAGHSWYLPNAAVEYPFWRSISASGVMFSGRTPVWPGKAVAVSMIEPVLHEWWLRPVSRAMRVGEQRAVVWKRLYFSPPAASFSQVGMRTGPPKALDCPK